jgi:DNA-binding response OmpR family regulator
MNHTILVVEDEPDLAASCVRVLQRRRWRARTAATRQAGLDAVTGPCRPALAIVDRRLPDGDGLDVVRAARAAGTPAIVTSGHDWAGTRRLALDAGASAFLGKPYSMHDLLGAVEAVLGPPPPAPINGHGPVNGRA